MLLDERIYWWLWCHVVQGVQVVAKIDQLKRELRDNLPSGFNAGEAGSGREASHPGEIPVPGWKDIFWRAWKEVSEANLFLVAGGVTYAILLALFPGLAALVSLYGLLLNPSQVETQIAALSHIMMPESTQMIGDQREKLVSPSSGSLSISAGVALVLALW